MAVIKKISGINPDSTFQIGLVTPPELRNNSGVLEYRDNGEPWKTFDLSSLQKEPTGFTSPEDITVTYSSSTRKVTLTGTVNGYYRGEKITALTSGWISDAHSATLDKLYFLVYDGTAFDWLEVGVDPFDFAYILIALVNYGTSDKWCLRECHGMMTWQSHKEFHETIGTYKDSGGTLADYTLDSTTAADRRPSVSVSEIADEDLTTTIAAWSAGGNYTQYYLSGAGGTANFNTTATDIVPLSTNRPYFNEFTGGVWTQTLVDNNDYMALWVIQIPTTADSESQAYRTIFAQGQQIGRIRDIRALAPTDYNAGGLTSLTPESVFIAKVIIRYSGGNWQLKEVNALTGTRYSQAQSPTGNYLSSVTTDSTLTGIGTTGDPLGIDLTNANTWAGVQTFSSFPVLPSTHPTTDYQAAHKVYVDSVNSLFFYENTVGGL